MVKGKSTKGQTTIYKTMVGVLFRLLQKNSFRLQYFCLWSCNYFHTNFVH